MRVIGVVDLLAGRAVHARQGMRDRYEPVRCVAGAAIAPGDAPALADAYATRLGLPEWYVADIDAILRQAPNDELVETLARAGTVWVDAGISSVEHARRIRALGAARVVVGLETLTSYDALQQICQAVGREHVSFSLDVRHGSPILADGGIPPGESPEVVAARAADAGAGAVMVIDLARVGTAAGIDLDLIGRIRKAAPAVMLCAGGGVRGPEDLVRLADAGCDGALVATALHDGRIGAADVAAIGHRNVARYVAD